MNAIVISQIQEQMNAAVECIEGGRFLEAKAAFLECARLTEILNIESKLPTPEVPKQLTIDIEPNEQRKI